jgi:hypothetical protein
VNDSSGLVRVLGIAGSPRRNGNSETLLDRFLAGARSAGAEVDKVVAARLNIAGCLACDGCWDDGQCVVQDDFHAINQKLVAADVIALAAPCYFWNLPAQVKALIDRSQCQWARKCVLKLPLARTSSGRSRRRGVFLCVGGDPQPDFGGTIRTVESFISLYEAKYWAELLVSDVDPRGAILEHPTALQEAFDLGVRSVEQAWD